MNPRRQDSVLGRRAAGACEGCGRLTPTRAPIQRRRAGSCWEEPPNPWCKYDPFPTWTVQAGRYLLPMLVSRKPPSSGWSGKPRNVISMVWTGGKGHVDRPTGSGDRRNHAQGPGLCVPSATRLPPNMLGSPHGWWPCCCSCYSTSSAWRLKILSQIKVKRMLKGLAKAPVPQGQL